MCVVYLHTTRASGVAPSLEAASAVISTKAEAPSFRELALAAVTVPGWHEGEGAGVGGGLSVLISLLLYSSHHFGSKTKPINYSLYVSL